MPEVIMEVRESREPRLFHLFPLAREAGANPILKVSRRRGGGGGGEMGILARPARRTLRARFLLDPVLSALAPQRECGGERYRPCTVGITLIPFLFSFA